MKYYLTTPIYYVNAAPHIGHAYTTIVADFVRRFKTMQGYRAVLTTGSDEHGVNVERAAQRAGKTPKEYTDVIAAEFENQWKLLGLQIDRFQRTTNRSMRAWCRICSSAAARTATSTRDRTPASTASTTTST